MPRRRSSTRNWARDGLALMVGAGLAVVAFTALPLVTAAMRHRDTSLDAPPAAPSPAAKLVAAKPRPAPTQPAPAQPAQPTPAPASQPADILTVRRVLPIDGPIKYGEWHWDDAGVPDGPIVITVDLEAETLSVFKSGYEIGATAVLYGADFKPTPLGVYPIKAKLKDHYSSTYGGAPMPYTLRLTNDGVSVHGSTVVPNAATHGCIGVPKAFAAKMFAAAHVGDPVIITRGKRLTIGGAIAPKG